MNRHRQNTFAQLARLGINTSHAAALVRASATLHTWHERECNGEIEQDEKTGRWYWWHDSGPRGRMRGSRTSDREAGAIKRINRILVNYPGLSAYIQGDPRGCALYIIRPGDVPEGCDVDGYYSRGIAVVP